MTKDLIHIDLIEIIQFYFKIYDVCRHSHLDMGQWVGSGQIINYRINFDLIRIIQFCFVETPPAMGGCVGGWMDGWVDVWVLPNH